MKSNPYLSPAPITESPRVSEGARGPRKVKVAKILFGFGAVMTFLQSFISYVPEPGLICRDTAVCMVFVSMGFFTRRTTYKIVSAILAAWLVSISVRDFQAWIGV
ncbi:MAG: hypothetical protein AB8B55_14220 [Mariniblastus sp.]